MTDLALDNQEARKSGLSYGYWRATVAPPTDVRRKYTNPHKRKGHGLDVEEHRHWKFDVEQFVKLYNQGYSDSEIAEMLEVPREIAHHKRCYGLKVCRNSHRAGEMLSPPEKKIDLRDAMEKLAPKYPIYDIRAFCKAYNAGMKPSKIGEAAGCSTRQAAKMISKFGLTSNYLRGGKRRNPDAKPISDEEIEALVQKWQR